MYRYTIIPTYTHINIINTVEYRYNASNYTKIVTLSITIASSIHWSDMNSQQSPHVPPLQASHGTFTVSNMGIRCCFISGFGCTLLTVLHPPPSVINTAVGLEGDIEAVIAVEFLSIK